MLAFLTIIALTALYPTPAVLADNEIRVLEQLVEGYPDWTPRGIVDVGANKGGWTTSIQTKVFPNQRIPTFMVEASPQHQQELDKVKERFPHVIYKIAVLSGVDGDKVQFFGKGGTGDSMFREQSQHYDGIRPEVRTTLKLDTLVTHMEHIDYLKIDVQGAELMVLQGATETLKRATFVQMEASAVGYNQGGACWFDLDVFMRQHGFYFYDSADYFRHPLAFHTKGIGQFDVLYVRPTSEHMPQWLKDANVSFCGSNRANEATGGAKLLHGTMEDDTTARTLATGTTLLMGFFATFLFGYFAGKGTRFMGLSISQGRKHG